MQDELAHFASRRTRAAGTFHPLLRDLYKGGSEHEFPLPEQLDIRANLLSLASRGATADRAGPDSKLLAALRDVVGERGIVEKRTSLKVYECDGYTLEKAAPGLVLLPQTTAEAARIVTL